MVGKPEEKRPFGRPRPRWEDNTVMDLRQIGWEGANWIHVTQYRVQWQALMNTGMDLWVP